MCGNSLFNSELLQEPHHRAPVRECRLKQVQADKRGKEIPIRMHPMSERQGREHEGACNHSKVAINSHFALLNSLICCVRELPNRSGRVAGPTLAEVIKHRHGHTRKNGRSHFTGHQRQCQTLENRIEQNYARTYYDSCGGQQHRTEADSAGIDYGSSRGMPCDRRNSMKSTRMMEFRTMIPAPAMNPIMEVAVKNAPMRVWAGRIPTKVSGIGAMMISGVLNDPNHPTTST